MATLTTNYNGWTSIAITAVTTTLDDAQWAFSAIVDNSSTKYVDALVSGQFVTGSGASAGGYIEVYAYAQYSSTSTDITSGISTNLSGTDAEETEGTDFHFENLIPVATIVADAASETLHWGPYSIAQAFGGVLPSKWGLAFRNETNGAMGSGSDCGYDGIKFDVA